MRQFRLPGTRAEHILLVSRRRIASTHLPRPCPRPPQFGGQTPLKLATLLQRALEANPIPAASGNGNVRIWGTSPDRCATLFAQPCTSCDLPVYYTHILAA